MSDSARLYGFYDLLIGDFHGFLRPIFENGDNYLMASGKGGKVTEFIEADIEPDETDLVLPYKGKEVTCRLGDKLIYGFAFSKKDIIFGSPSEVAGKLEKRVSEIKDHHLKEEVESFIKHFKQS